jgi:hypothetical protein
LDDGVIAVLPEDEHGRNMVCVDESRRNTGYSTEALLRCAFCILSALVEKQVSQTDSVVGIIMIVGASFEFEGIKEVTQLMQQAIPMRCEAIHIVCLPPDGTVTLFKETIVSSLLKFCKPSLAEFPEA